MHELMDDCVGELLAYKAGHQVEVIVVDHHQRAQRTLLGLAHDGVGELPVDLHVAGVPCIVDKRVHVGRVRGAPHIVL